MNIKLTDPGLFGNDAAEEEDDEIFNSYALWRDEFNDFIDVNRAIVIARAYKGEGKSALLRMAKLKVCDQSTDPIVISGTASKLAPNLQTSDYFEWTRSWKKNIAGHIATQVGSKIGFAWSDDEMSLVEQAEKDGTKSKSFLSAILDRFPIGQVQIDPANVSLSGLKVNRQGASNPEEIIRRWADGKPPIWIFVDDIDKNFANTPIQCAKIGSFFDAVRELRLAIPELKIRAAIRPNVWTIVKMEFESMSHVEQYMCDLAWSEDDVRKLLANRIQGYLTRTNQWDEAEKALPKQTAERDKRLISFIFENNMDWGTRTRPAHVVLYTLAKHRPRWMIELCKQAAQRSNGKIINKNDIIFDYDKFGQRRIQDTVAEFRSHCPDVGELIDAFHRQEEEYTTDVLLSAINKRILNHMSPKISGVLGISKARDVAAFLFEIGFIYARENYPDGTYRHISFSEKPSLLRSRTAVDQGLMWEIHPVYRQALEIRDIYGRRTN